MSEDESDVQNGKKQNITTRSFPKWDEYKDKQPPEAVASIYAYITAVCKEITDWYWKSIQTKRRTSLIARGFAFSLLVAGTAGQIYATTLKEAVDRLEVTQLAVASFAIATLMLIADRAFGWSGGWMRYITTVTTMENLTRAFQLEWAKYFVTKTTPLDATDTKALFQLAQGLEQELLKLQADETTKWVAEFNAGIILLESAIKTQREETEKKLDAIRTTLSSQEAAAKAEEKSRATGSIELTLTHKTEVKKVQIKLDGDASVDFFGTSWGKVGVPPGQHSVRIITTTDPPQYIDKVIDVQPSTVAKVEVKLGE